MMEKYSDLMHYPQSFYINCPGSTSATEPTRVNLLFLILIITLLKRYGSIIIVTEPIGAKLLCLFLIIVNVFAGDLLKRSAFRLRS